MPPLVVAFFVTLFGIGSCVKNDEYVLFFPTYAAYTEQTQTWTLNIHGWIFEPEPESFSRRIALTVLRRLLGLRADQAETVRFKQRAWFFLVDSEQGKEVAVQLGDTIHPVGISQDTGHFRGTIRLSDQQMNNLLKEQKTADRLTFHAVTLPDDPRILKGTIHLIPPTGVSIVSDIDDTIKISEVLDRKALIANVFLEEYKPVPGMPAFYRHLRERYDAGFHYVSSSPWQLYRSLSEFIQTHQYPEGSFHLRPFNWKKADDILEFLDSPVEYKLRTIEPILRDFPRRQFIFIGDANEKDPEIYGELARRYPDQLLHIYIRNTTGESADNDRFTEAFKNIPPDRWTLFDDPEELFTPQELQVMKINYY